VKTIASAVILACIVYVSFANAPHKMYGYSSLGPDSAWADAGMRLPLTFAIIAISFVLASLVGVLCTLSRAPWWQTAIAATARALRAIPFFWLAFVLQFVILVHLGSLGAGRSPNTPLYARWYLILPICLLAIAQLPAIVEYLCRRRLASPIERTSLPRDLFAIFADRLPAIITTAIVVELFFALPGESPTLFSALSQSDIALFSGIIVCSALLVLVVRFVAGPRPYRAAVGGALSKRALPLFATAGVVLLLLFALGALLWDSANVIDNRYWTGDPIAPCFLNAARCGGHLLGSDEVGRDLLARMVVGGAMSLGFSIIALIGEFTFAAVMGALVRYGGAPVGFVVACVLDALSSLPALPYLVALSVIAYDIERTSRYLEFGAPIVAILIGILFTPKLVRAAADAKRGGLANAVIDRAGRDWGTIILLAATLDFFGFGPAPPMPTWGNMLGNMQATVSSAWWVAVFPAVCIVVAVLLIDIARRSALHPNSHDAP